MTALVDLPKSKGLAFGAYFLHDFFYRNVLYLIPYQLTKF